MIPHFIISTPVMGEGGQHKYCERSLCAGFRKLAYTRKSFPIFVVTSLFVHFTRAIFTLPESGASVPPCLVM